MTAADQLATDDRVVAQAVHDLIAALDWTDTTVDGHPRYVLAQVRGLLSSYLDPDVPPSAEFVAARIDALREAP